MQDHEIREMPAAPKFRQLLGPSFILLGLGLGSGEIILWPYLTSNFGLGILWGAALGVAMQFFINMEIERYTLARGESVFVGFARKLRFLPIWFIFSTLIPWIWPGIIKSSAVLFGEVLGIKNTRFLAITLLFAVGVILTLGPVLYKTQEFFQKAIIITATPLVILLSFFIAKISDWTNLGWGIVGRGDGFWFLPEGIPIVSFLAAIAYAGAGGNLNLAQSFYIKEKGFGMGKYGGRITSILTGAKEKTEIFGATFVPRGRELERFRDWWRLINIEHALVFWLTGTLTIILLSFLAFLTVFGHGEGSNIAFVIDEAFAIGEKTFPLFGKLFLLIAALMLFSTQLGVMDTTSRILTENLSLISAKMFPTELIRRNFYIFLWVQIILGAIILSLGFSEPLFLLTLAAVLNAVAMFVYIPLTLWLNLTRLEEEIRPGVVRILAMSFTFIFFGYLTARTILSFS